MAESTEPKPRVLRVKTVVVRTGLPRSTVYDKLNPNSPRYDRTFPRPFKIGQQAVGWLESEIDAWILAAASHRE
ncbi:MAG: AlpA family phage regulatory protein [Proteobacteria bacterium]|nr:AlpA family phage regulatory protein [Pseudomonadota bacterium]